MNSYTLIFKIYFAIVGVLLLFITVDLIFGKIIEDKTHDSSFISYIKDSKRRLLLKNNTNFNAIFIGSSKTQFNISSNILKQPGFIPFNLGVSGIRLNDYPYLIEAAIQKQPKYIFISIPIRNLYDDKISASNYITLIDLKYIIKSFNLNKDIIRYVPIALKNEYLPFHYAQVINEKIKNFYTKFNFKINDYHHSGKKNKVQSRNTVNNLDKQNIDCNLWNTNKKFGICTNGDGIYFTKFHDNSSIEIIDFNKPSQNKVNFLKLIAVNLRKHNIEPVLILEPTYKTYYNYQEDLNQLFNFQVIDLTNLIIKDSYWSDQKHFNNQGRIFYSKHLLEELNMRNIIKGEQKSD